MEHNDLRFFNALVCILLPDSNSMQGFWDFEEYKDDQGIPIGGLGKLKIVKEVGRVVLDGQHRFVALQQYWKAKRDSAGPDTNVDIAIVFVIVDELGRIGKKTPDVRTKTIGAVRNLFAVLNKTARSVDKTTLLLIDDTNIFNVMTRSLIEQKLVDELVIKWTGGDNLQPQDPYFSTINVLKDALTYYLSDFGDELSMECGTDTERDNLIKKYYEKTPGFEVSAARGVSYLFEQTGPVKTWRKHLRLVHVTLMPQPESMQLDRTQAKALEAERKAQLCFTVAGQKAMFRAMIEVFRHQPRRDQAALEKVGKKVSGLIDRGFFSRKPEEPNPFFGLMFDAKGRMSWAEGPVDLARRILAVAAGSPADRKSVCSDYEVQTSRPSSIVTEYWKRAGA